MARLRASFLLSVCVLCALCCVVWGSGDSLEVDAELEDAASSFPIMTLLENTAIAGNKWAPTPRTRLEKLAMTQLPPQPEYLGANNNQELFFASDAKTGPQDAGRAGEPIAAHFVAGLPQPKGDTNAGRALRGKCGKGGCKGKKTQKKSSSDHEYPGDMGERDPSNPEPLLVPPPPEPPRPAPKNIKKKPKFKEYPNPPVPQLPLASPPKPTCVGACNPKDKDNYLARVPAAPLGPQAVANSGLEGKVLAKIIEKMRIREGWLREQKLWLNKAVEAAATVRREIELASFTRDAVASDLEQLKAAQDHLSLKFKADQLKWAFKDKKITLSELKERFEALEHAKADVAHQIREAKDEVIILENTLGPPSQQVQISPLELEDPLDFLKDVHPEETYGA